MAEKYVDVKLLAFIEAIKDMPLFSSMLKEGAYDYITRRRIANNITLIGEDPAKLMLNPPTEEEAKKWGLTGDK